MKTILITGASSGIGAAAARQLAALGHRVVLHARTGEKGEPVRQEIAAATGNENVSLLTADFGALEAVRALAAAFRAQYDRLDVLINNAGLYLSKRTETPDGFETTWAVNHLAPFLLTNLLLDRLKASAPARIINVASNAHTGGHINFDDLQMRERFNGLGAYAQSKLANILFSYELARRLDGTGVTAVAMHPGVVNTGIWERNTGLIDYFLRGMSVLYKSPKKSARAVVRLAVDPALEGVTGTYFDQMKEKKSAAASYDEAVAARLWQVSEEATGLA